MLKIKYYSDYFRIGISYCLTIYYQFNIFGITWEHLATWSEFLTATIYVFTVFDFQNFSQRSDFRIHLSISSRRHGPDHPVHRARQAVLQGLHQAGQAVHEAGPKR